jgi:hypothetical protein
MADLFTFADVVTLGFLGLALPALGVCRALHWHRIGGTLSAVILMAAGLAFWKTDVPAFLPCVAAAISSAYLFAVSPESLQKALSRAITSRRAMVLLLIVGGWLGAGGWIAHVVDRALPPGLDASQLLPAYSPIDGVELSESAYTDRGRSIRLLGYPPSDEMDHEMLKRNEKWYAQLHEFALIRVGPADRICNCHGWVFTNGRYNLHSEDVDMILTDNRYRIVTEPIPGDLVIYRDGLDRPIHTAVVKLVAGSLILVESKWGHLGVFLHPVEAQPYGNDWAFMRTDRPNHLLRLSPPEMDDMHSTP